MDKSKYYEETGGDKQLLWIAECAALNARPKHSGYYVGAAIYDTLGCYHKGCNIEFDNYSMTIHAEAAVISAMCTLSLKAKIVAIAVWTAKNANWMPCGSCRQIISDMAAPDAICLAGSSKNYDKILVRDLLPGGAYSLSGKRKNKKENK
jgi:cytidine deaminase